METETKFSATTFLKSNGESYGQTLDGIWLALVQDWFTTYSGFPNRLRTDRSSVFMLDRWKPLANLNGIALRLLGVQECSSLRNWRTTT